MCVVVTCFKCPLEAFYSKQLCLCIITLLTLIGAHGVERRKCVNGWLFLPALCWIFVCTVWGLWHCLRCPILNYCVEYCILCCGASIINLVESCCFRCICRSLLGYSCGFLFSLHAIFAWCFYLGLWHILFSSRCFAYVEFLLFCLNKSMCSLNLV